MRVCENCGVEFEGSSQARFHSDACRKAFARKQGGIPAAETPLEEIEDETPLPPLAAGRNAPPLQEYVARMMGEARVDAVAGHRHRPEVYTVEERVKRAGEYARWRWQGFQAGEIASL